MRHPQQLELLGWMRRQPFERIGGPLLTLMEEAVVEEHGLLHGRLLGEPWSPPTAYRWIRYESQDPAGQLQLAVERLEREWQAAAGRDGYADARRLGARLIGERVEAALELARALGFAPKDLPYRKG